MVVSGNALSSSSQIRCEGTYRHVLWKVYARDDEWTTPYLFYSLYEVGIRSLLNGLIFM